MSISDPQFAILFLLNTQQRKSYTQIYTSIPNNRRRFHSKLPISKGMLYKRIFELKKSAYIQTEIQKIFPSYAVIQLTDKAQMFLKAMPMLLQFMHVLTNASEGEKYLHDLKKGKQSQTTILSFMKQIT